MAETKTQPAGAGGETFRPETAAQVAEVVAWAAAEEQPLDVFGKASKRGLGRPVQSARGLDLSALTGITFYEPEELVLTARAGTPLAEIEAAVAEKRQMLAFEPPDLGPLYGRPEGEGTVGGLLACNLSGPRRIKAGAARDHFLGLEAVSGRGEIFKSGGRVVKNVTGYDLSKLLAGSYGTLAALTEVTLKVLPRPEKTYTVLVYGLDEAGAVQAMTRALGTSHEVSGAAHLPASMAARSAVGRVSEAGGAVTAIRVEGPGPSVLHRAECLRRELADLGETEELHSTNSLAFWREIGAARPLGKDPDRLVWRLSVPPASGGAVLAAIRQGVAAAGAESELEAFLDWGGGLIWLSLPPPGAARGVDAWAGPVREGLAPYGGHATLVRAPESIRAAVAVFQPQEPAKAALSERIKRSFDPQRVLNPGRVYSGV